MLRVALVGFWHVHARDYAREALAHPGVDLVAAWDDDPARGAAGAAEFGVPFTPDLDALLARDDLDGVIVTTATRDHAEVIPAALGAGKHVFSEKVLAPTRAGAVAIARVATDTGRVLRVSMTRLPFGSTRAIRETVARGDLGQVTQMRVRVAHDGAVRTPDHPDGWLPARFHAPDAAGGGALIDLGAHPLYLTRAVLGMPERVHALYGHVTERAVEDNAAVLLHYADGAIGVAETGFVSTGPFTAIEVNGTRGNLVLGPHDGELRVRTAPRGPWQSVPLPPDGPTPFAAWVDAAVAGVPDPEHLVLAVDLSALAEAANRSAEAGAAVAVPRGTDQ